MSSLRCVLLLILPVILFGASSFAENVKASVKSDIPEADPPINYRLSSDVIPILYTIKLEPNIVPGDFTFAGESRIDIEVKNKSSEIVLHAKDLTIQESYTSLLFNDTVVENVKLTFAYENVTNFYKIKLSTPISPEKYTLLLKYTGILHDDMNGFYRSSYINEQGEEIWLATTQFEPTWARRAFPCFDEPALKAKFKIYIKHLDTYSAISNMPAVSMTRPKDDILQWWTEFAVTPVMSTYLVAFIVSDFSHLSADNGTFRVYSRNNAIEMGKFAQSIGPLELKHLENYTGIEYGLPKMDNFAIPQFRAGAMENWGIVTYRESALLYGENVTSTDNKQGIATVISHEFAHQWFGNLVSPSWWKFTWLNEGFANYFQYFITDKVEPTWRLMDQFVIKNLQETAFMADDNATQHPMDVEVNSPDEISKIFDSITYSKAGSVIRMFSHALNEPVFQAGLHNYLEKYKYSATTSDDLFESLQEVAGKTVKVDLVKALITWARQPGYPVVTVIRNHTSGDATISQKRFLTKSDKKHEELWYIPINFASEDKRDFVNTMPGLWMRNTTYAITGLPTGKWVIFNRQQTGYYRVNYDDENWKLLADYLKNPKNKDEIHVLNRAQLLDDSFNLAQAGELPNHKAFLELSEYLQHEDDYAPWHAAYRAFSALDKALANTEKYDLFKLYVLRLINKLEKTVGYEESAKDDHIIRLNRLNAIRLACRMGSDECLISTRNKFVKHINGTDKLSPDLRSIVLCAGMRSANTTLWEATYNLTAKMEPKSSERNTTVNALGCSSNPVILAKFLKDTLLIESEFNRDDAVKAVYSNSAAGIDIAFSFITNNREVIIDYDGNINPIVKSLNEIAKRMTTAAQVEKLNEFITTLPEGNEALAEALKAQALVKAKENVEWVKKYGPDISSFLDAQKLVEDEPNSSNISFSSIWLVTVAVLVACLRQS